MTPATPATQPPATRMIPNARRWRYSYGAMTRRMPDRGGDAHHARRPLGKTLSSGAFTKEALRRSCFDRQPESWNTTLISSGQPERLAARLVEDGVASSLSRCHGSVIAVPAHRAPAASASDEVAPPEGVAGVRPRRAARRR